VLEPPASRALFPDLTPAILVESPTPGDVIQNPLFVTGVANTFEGKTSFRLLDAGGRTLSEAQGTGGTMGVLGRIHGPAELRDGQRRWGNRGQTAPRRRCSWPMAGGEDWSTMCLAAQRRVAGRL